MEKLTSDQALRLIQAGDVEGHAGFDVAEAGRLGLALGQTVAVTPTDTGKWTLHAPIVFRPYLSLATGREKPSNRGHTGRVEQGGSDRSGQRH